MLNWNKNIEDQNRSRLRKLLTSTKPSDLLSNWEKITFSIGGLTEIGFSEKQDEILLVLSSQGRGLINCNTFELIARDDEPYGDWVNFEELWCMGIAEFENERFRIAGLHGGGLSYYNKFGEDLEYMGLNWPISSVVFCPRGKSLYDQNESMDCYRIFEDHELRVYGFSRSGNHIVIATSSELNIWKRKTA